MLFVMRGWGPHFWTNMRPSGPCLFLCRTRFGRVCFFSPCQVTAVHIAKFLPTKCAPARHKARTLNQCCCAQAHPRELHHCHHCPARPLYIGLASAVPPSPRAWTASGLAGRRTPSRALSQKRRTQHERPPPKHCERQQSNASPHAPRHCPHHLQLLPQRRPRPRQTTQIRIPRLPPPLAPALWHQRHADGAQDKEGPPGGH